MAWRLGGGDVAGDDRFENDLSKEFADFGVDFAGELEAVVVHGEHDAAELEAGLVRFHDLPHDLDHLRQAFHCIVFALDGHQQFIGAGERG